MTEITLNWTDAELPPEEIAVRAQEEIASLKLRIEELEARRAEAIEKAMAAGIKTWGGYRFIARTPAPALDEGILADEYGTVMDEYIAWWPSAHPPKLTKTDFQKFLKKKHPEDADAILGAISTESGETPTYALMKMKEGSE